MCPTCHFMRGKTVCGTMILNLFFLGKQSTDTTSGKMSHSFFVTLVKLSIFCIPSKYKAKRISLNHEKIIKRDRVLP